VGEVKLDGKKARRGQVQGRGGKNMKRLRYLIEGKEEIVRGQLSGVDKGRRNGWICRMQRGTE